MLESLLKRLKEPSTYAGLGGLAAVLGISVDMFDSVVAMIVAGAGFVLSIIMKEKPE